MQRNEPPLGIPVDTDEPEPPVEVAPRRRSERIRPDPATTPTEVVDLGMEPPETSAEPDSAVIGQGAPLPVPQAPSDPDPWDLLPPPPEIPILDPSIGDFGDSTPDLSVAGPSVPDISVLYSRRQQPVPPPPAPTVMADTTITEQKKPPTRPRAPEPPKSRPPVQPKTPPGEHPAIETVEAGKTDPDVWAEQKPARKPEPVARSTDQPDATITYAPTEPTDPDIPTEPKRSSDTAPTIDEPPSEVKPRGSLPWTNELTGDETGPLHGYAKPPSRPVYDPGTLPETPEVPPPPAPEAAHETAAPELADEDEPGTPADPTDAEIDLTSDAAARGALEEGEFAPSKTDSGFDLPPPGEESELPDESDAHDEATEWPGQTAGSAESRTSPDLDLDANRTDGSAAAEPTGVETPAPTVPDLHLDSAPPPPADAAPPEAAPAEAEVAESPSSGDVELPDEPPPTPLVDDDAIDWSTLDPVEEMARGRTAFDTSLSVIMRELTDEPTTGEPRLVAPAHPEIVPPIATEQGAGTVPELALAPLPQPQPEPPEPEEVVPTAAAAPEPPPVPPSAGTVPELALVAAPELPPELEETTPTAAGASEPQSAPPSAGTVPELDLGAAPDPWPEPEGAGTTTETAPEPQPEAEEAVPTVETADDQPSVPELAIASVPESAPEHEEAPTAGTTQEAEPIPEAEPVVSVAEKAEDRPSEDEPHEPPVEPLSTEPILDANEFPSAEPVSDAAEPALTGLPDTAPPPVWGAAGGTGSAPLSGGYTLLRELARGGTGVAYLALDTALRRRVVLKTLRDDLVRHDDLLARFVREIRITAALEHPNITRLYSWGTRNRVPFMVLEHLEGGTLLELLTMHGSGWSASLLEPLAQVCDGLHYAHSRGVVHRDVKLSNVFVSAAGRGAIFDWSIAHVFAEIDGDNRFIDGSLGGADAANRDVSEERFWGTPAYMAPEQARGDVEQIGPQTDVFALGANLFHLAAGRPPDDGVPVADLLRARADGDVPRLRDVRPKAPSELDEICARAMAFLPGDRHPTAAALGAEIREFLAAQAAASEW